MRFTKLPARCFVLSGLFALTASAGNIYYGPMQDYAGTIYVPGTQFVATSTLVLNALSRTGTSPIYDYTYITFNKPVKVYVASYVILRAHGDPIIDSLDMFDVWAMDITPDGGPLSLTGFTPGDPELVPADDEHFYCCENSVIDAPFTTYPVGALSTVLDGFDLSEFSNADPNSIVYVAEGDGLDPNCPEPATWVLLAGGLGVCGLSRRLVRR